MRYLITCAFPYANGPLHLGHLAGSYLPGDCYARFQRMQGNEVLFLSGSDEHGVAVALSAEQVGRTPADHAAFYTEQHIKMFDKLLISFDHYTRTTLPTHASYAQKCFTRLQQRELIDERICDQLYSPKENRFYADRYVVGKCPVCTALEARGDECPTCAASYEATDLLEPRAKLSGEPLIRRATRHWFLRLDLLQEKLNSWLSERDWHPRVLAFANRYVEDIRPRAITRDSNWGIPVPGSAGKVLYVWFEAPLGYISGTQRWAERHNQAWEEYWLEGTTRLAQFIGKDNVPFHAALFPATLLGLEQGYKLVDYLFASEFYHFYDKPFSKTDGAYFDMDKCLQVFTAEQLRYVVAATAPETRDTSFSWETFEHLCNGELLAKLGNTAQRILVFIQKQGGLVPEAIACSSGENELRASLAKALTRVADSYECGQLRKVTQILVEISQLGSIYLEKEKPWKIENQKHLATVLHMGLLVLQALSIAAAPLLPKLATKLWEMIGMEGDQKWREIGNLPVGKRLPPPQILVKKIEKEQIAIVRSF